MSIPSPFNTESGLAPRVNALEVVSAEARTAQIEAACSQLFVALFLVLLQRASQVASWVMTLGINEFCQSSYGQQAVNLDAADANVERGDGEIVAWRKTLERISWAWKAARIMSAVLIPSSIALFQIERVLRNSAPFVCTSFAFLFALAAFASSCLLAGMMPKLATSHLSDIWIKATQGSVTWKGTSPASVQFWILVELPLCSAAW
ncbi:unnamed protein product [Cyclocybe aegerita]|uniref:Uncharacterized protein n=1 Tax=Cyclocybe aegerita TaxID=1973307 RepID=A0A8S0VWJ9_CYCAE|nr:unnamed protein product [Cyclocybe aegerita]